MKREQYVCLACGFNMVGFHPAHCPFCGAGQSHFITAEECTNRYRVAGQPVNGKVTRLNSVPALGIEHAAYRIETGSRCYWIDCPSCFDPSLTKTDAVLFTHHHFLGASNLYRDLFSAQVQIHKLDSAHEICRPFSFDTTFEANFTSDGIEAHHIGGHTPGFTCYVFEDVLFACDYVFLDGDGMKYNPFGPAAPTIAGGELIREIVESRELATVCGYNYVIGYDEWKLRFDAGPIFGGH